MTEIGADRLLACLDVSEIDKFVLIEEHNLADSNFVLSHLMKQVLNNKKNKICFVMMHNTVGHYHNVGKRLGYDLLGKVKDGSIAIIEPMTAIFDELMKQSYGLYTNKVLDQMIIALETAIKSQMQTFKVEDGGHVHMIIDDLSHLFDIGIGFGKVVNFVSSINKFTHQKNFNVLINMHIGDENDHRISSALELIADIHIDVAPLKTGHSSDVTGVLTITKDGGGSENIYHYKALEREIRTFRPGESLNFLYR
ncbi:PREDICTED: elongator complex protein 6 [Nicrophorus vespilloides]|uniref:Elongator complex protein 6 n=1 Tax=Nicrophorus vespilloides TaxID=110193 RepID=A0ABM1NDV9_NICVS|nr:PREDICTED: elongator complex protein 6 [Nicrophorus vespilloides]